ncbi:MAG: hypothetical protein LBT93_08485 [Treponema sp.]|jgi:hypothetical protein|nr:hypothetical protein [Treponema sp.]
MDALKKNFLNPGAEYSPFPFWFWNDALDKAEILRQIRDFKDKGVDGFVLHPRIGIPREVPYLSEAFFDLARTAVEEARALGMRVILYDEGMYPSGSANGQVVRANPAYASRGLRLAGPIRGGTLPLEKGDEPVALVAARERPGGQFDLASARLISGLDAALPEEAVYGLICSFTRGTIRGIHAGEDDGEPGAPPSTDLLNEAAVASFIHLTHDVYYKRLGSYFGNTIIAFFTDEPNIMGRNLGGRHFVPWTPGFEADFTGAGLSLTELPALFLDAGPATAEIRRGYERAVDQRLIRSFYRPISRWCEDHSIALTGHPESSEDMGLLSLLHIPGQDIVWRWVAPEQDLALGSVHSVAAKCASDAARHAGKSRNLNECFGCCGPADNLWAFTAGDMKWYLDYLFVRGCNFIVPHAFYYSLRTKQQYGERPPDVGPGNIWWPHYRTISTYIKRMSFLLTGINQTELAVLCGEKHLPYRIVRTLYENQIEFNYLDRRTLLNTQVEGGLLRIAQQSYRVVLVEDETLPEEPAVKAALAPFTAAGGSVLCPAAIPGGQLIPILLEKLSPAVRVLPPVPGLRMTHLVLEGRHLVVLVNEGDTALSFTLSMNLEGLPEIWDPLAGTCARTPCLRDGERLLVPVLLDRLESRAVVLAPARRLTIPRPEASAAGAGRVEYDLSFEWKGPSGQARLVLGDVGALAEVTVNGVFAGALLWKPFALDIPVQSGTNRLHILVRESMANRYGKPVPSGLLGDIIITERSML